MNNTQKSALFSDALNIARIKKSTTLKGNLYHFETIDSTNSWLLENGNAGDICISEMQTAGRGRRGNKWVSPPSGNIYFSMIWDFAKPLQQIEHQSLLGLVSGIAIAESLEEIGLREHGIKWPNDLFWKDQKLGGILIESINQSSNVIIGVGLNIHMSEQETHQIDQEVCCLNSALLHQNRLEPISETSLSRNQLVVAMIENLQKHLEGFTKISFDLFKQHWEKWDVLNNRHVSFTHRSEEVSGVVSGIDRHGRLGILDQTGKLSFYSSAEMKLRKPA